MYMWENALTTLGNKLAKYMRTTSPVKIKKAFFADMKFNFRDGYNIVLERLTQNYFPNGSSSVRKLTSMECFLVNSNEEAIDRDGKKEYFK